MQQSKQNTDSFPSRCTIRLDAVPDKTMKGRVYSEHYKKSFSFSNEFQMLSGMEDLFNTLGSPQAAFEARSFFNRKNIPVYRKAEDEMDDNNFNNANIIQDEKNTFIVNVQYRQNASWQGTITWVEQNVTQHFRSAFEMLKLMDEAGKKGSTEEIRWDDAK